MFIVDNVRVSFYHDIEQEDGKPVRGSTRCVIEEKRGDEFKRASYANAKCYAGDQFNKAIGRKVSLTRALDNPFLGYSKEFRTKIWKKYFELTKFPE